MKLPSLPALVPLLLLGHGTAGTPANPSVPLTPPTATDLLERVAAAAGGVDAERRVTSRVSNGFVITPAGRAPLTLYQKAVDRFLIVIDSPAGGLSRNAFDGSEAWSENRRGVQAKSGPDVAFVRREQTLHREVRLAKLFATVSVEGGEVVGDRRAVALRAVASDGTSELFLFDATSYLLVRHEVEIGGTLLRSDFEDYRPMDGIPIAHRIRRARPGFEWTTELVAVRQNVPVEDGLFVKPVAP